MIRRLTYGLIGLAFGLGAATGASAQTRELGAGGEMLDGIAALVDTGVVLRSELDARLRVVAENFLQAQETLPPEQRGELPPLSIMEQQVLDQLILEELQVQRAERIGIQIGDDILNQVLVEIAANIPVPFEELPAFFESIGIEYATFREDQRRDLQIRQLERLEVVEQIMINPRELEQCLDRTTAAEFGQVEYNISHILIGFSPEAEPDEIAAAEARAREIARQLDEGADFAQLAIANSDSQTALEGGSLGWRRGSELPTIFANDVIAMEVGQHSTPIRSGSGFHLVQLNESRGAEAQLVDQVRSRHILLEPTEVLDDDATRQRLQGIRDQLLEGDDFAAIASAVSDDSASAIDGGDLGWMTPDEFDPVFAGVLIDLEIGELSEPFQTRFGWHIVELTGEREYDMTDDLREVNCRNQIGNAKAIEEVELWRQRIRDQAFVLKRI